MTRAKGIDVSKWQPTTPPLDGLSFLIARASVGLQKDELYDTHIANARKAGLIVGAYAFTYTTIDAADQADAFFRAAGNVDLYFNDVEGPYAQTRTQVAQFRNRGLARWGKDSGLYMSESVFYKDVKVAYRWVANWTRQPSIAWDFWQNRGSPLDLDQFNGTPADLAAFVGIPPAPPSDVDMGLRIKLDATLPDGDQYDDFGTAVLKSGSIRNVATGANVALPAGTSLGLVQKGWYLGEAGGPAFDPAVAIYAFNNGNELHIVPASQCSFTQLVAPPQDCTDEVAAATQALKAQNALLTTQVTDYESRLRKINGLSAI